MQTEKFLARAMPVKSLWGLGPSLNPGSCLFLKQAIASECVLNALWCDNSCEIPARTQTLSESESACLFVDIDIRHVLIVTCLRSKLIAPIVGKQYEH